MATAKGAPVLTEKEISGAVVGAAIEIHKALGPGLPGAAYEECLCYELAARGLAYRRNVEVPLAYKQVRIPTACSIDVLVEETVVVLVCAAEQVTAADEATLGACLRVARKKVGLILNFGAPVMREGIVRKTLGGR